MLQYHTLDEEVLSFIESDENEHYRATALHDAAKYRKVDLLEEWRHFLEKCQQIVESFCISKF